MHTCVSKNWFYNMFAIALLALLGGCGAGLTTASGGTTATPRRLVINPSSDTVAIGGAAIMQAMLDGEPLSGGQWSVSAGSIDANGLFTAPSTLPNPDSVTVRVTDHGDSASALLQIINPAPVLTSVNPMSLTQLSTSVTLSGSGFVAGSQVLVNNTAVPTTFIDINHLSTTVILPDATNGVLELAVANPAPGPAVSDQLMLPTSFPVSIVPSRGTVPIGGSAVMQAIQGGLLLSGGQWSVSAGSIDANGHYIAPSVVPNPSAVTVKFNEHGNTASAVLQITNPVPILESVSPAMLSQVSTPITLLGSGFVSGSQVLLNSAPVPTTFVDPNHLITTISLLHATNAVLQLAVANPSPGPSVSASLDLPASFPISIQPSISMVPIGDTAIMQAMQGGAPLSGGQWNVSAGSIDASGLFTAPLVLPGSGTVTVSFAQNGATASTVLQIINPVPVLSSLIPSTLTQVPTPITLQGSGFVTGSQVIINSAPVATTFVDTHHLTVIVAPPQASGTSLRVAVVNPAPGGTTSAQLDLPINLPISINPSSSIVPVGSSAVMQAMQDGALLSGGQWTILDGPTAGSIDAGGIYTAPSVLPSPSTVTVQFTLNGVTASTVLQITNSVPVLRSITPASLAQLSTPVTLSGSGFLPGSQILVNGTLVPTTFVDAYHLVTTIDLPRATNLILSLAVANPGPGGVTSAPVSLPTSFVAFTVAPAVLSPGQINLTLTGTQLSPTSVVTLDGKLLATTWVSPSTITATGYLAPWKSIAVDITLSASSTSGPEYELQVPLTPVPVSFDVAARFSTQAAFGPNPDVVLHIQQTGLQQFIREQLQVSGPLYPVGGRAPRSIFLQQAVQGPSLLRLRGAWALRSYLDVPNAGFAPAVAEWEQKLEAAVTGNYRDLLTAIASDPLIGGGLNLPGNAAPADPTEHPDQNFARELMQLFTLGVTKLNEDGTPQLDNDGAPIPTYDQNTVIELSRVFTGWEYPPIVNQAASLWGVDYSQTLVPVEAEHDSGQKVLFGSTIIPAHGTTTQDRDLALDAIFAHPNLPPFVSRILIQKFVKSSPSPAYVQRITNVFKDDGTGTRGNLAAVITAILLDPEARSGDTTPSPDDGFVQEPLLFEIFALSALQNSGTDDQFTYWPQSLGENFWVLPSVFSFYSPSYLIPGTTINSPEFSLLNNATSVHRSQLLWGMITGQQAGLNANPNAWLYQNFPDVPSLIEALNHLLYHGNMSAAEQDEIAAYCSSLDSNDLQTQLYSAVFLAMNSDAYTVSQ